MRKINLKRLEIFADMQKKICTVHDVREQLANLIYANAYGFVGHVLAHKVYESEGEIELTEAEARELGRLVATLGSAPLIDAVLSKLDLKIEDVISPADYK